MARPIRLNGVTYAKGLGAHAASDIRYALNGACSVLTAAVGVDDEMGTRARSCSRCGPTASRSMTAG